MKQAIAQETIARSKPLNHNSLLRRIKRRVVIGPKWMWPFMAMGVVPWVCVIAWLGQGMLWTVASNVSRWIWFASALFQLLTSSMGFIFVFARSRSVGANSWLRLSMVVYSLVLLVILAIGRIDWAAILYFSYSANNEITFRQYRSARRTVIETLAAVIMICAVVRHDPWIALSGVVLTLIEAGLGRRLLEIAEYKPARSVYVERQQEACAAGGG